MIGRRACVATTAEGHAHPGLECAFDERPTLAGPRLSRRGSRSRDAGRARALLKRAEGGEEAARRDLADRFAGPLEFGTAGLRGKVEAGLARMNRLVVIRASWGVGSHALEANGDDARARGVVIGFDGRHSSRQFAEDTASVLAGLGVKALLFTDPVPTPLLAFAVKQLGAVGGVMVTASHNPPQDNGYKVYLATGGQIIPPTDKAIAAKIKAAPRADRIARPAPADAAAGGLRAARRRDRSRGRAGVPRRPGGRDASPRRERAAADRLHADARRRPPADDSRVRAGGLRRRRRRADAGRSRRRLPHGLLPQPRGAGRHGPRARARRRDARRARARERSRRRPAGRRGARPLGPGLPDALGQRARRAAGRRRARVRGHRRPAEARRHHGRVLEPALAHGARPRRALPGDAHGLQVDRRRGDPRRARLASRS